MKKAATPQWPHLRTTPPSTHRNAQTDLNLRAANKHLEAFASGLAQIAAPLPPRSTAALLTLFLYAAHADISGAPATFTEIIKAWGTDEHKSLHSTYRVLLDGVKRADSVKREGLHWLEDTINPDNRREKHLTLTPTGKEILLKLTQTFQH